MLCKLDTTEETHKYFIIFSLKYQCIGILRPTTMIGFCSHECMQRETIIMSFNPFTPMRNQDRISPYNCQYNINQISDENQEKYKFGDNWLIQY